MTRDDTPLGPGGEFDLIRRLRDRWGPLAVALGDDAAVLDLARGDRLVASTDAAIENVHFRRDWERHGITLRDAGYRAVTAALSDLAAMAAAPLGVLVSLELVDADDTVVTAIADGIGDAVRAAGTTIRGGNVTRGAALGIVTTVLGSVYAPLRRAGAAPGDTLYVTGRLGGPAAALAALERGTPPADALRKRLVRPRARLAEARWLAAHGATAAIDISDGLAGDAGHLAAASAVVCEIDAERVPRVEGAQPMHALAGGEEYELLVSARAPLPESEFAARFGLPLTAVGQVAAGAPEVVIRERGRRVATPRAHDHFSR